MEELKKIEQGMSEKADKVSKSSKSILYFIWNLLGDLVWIIFAVTLISIAVVVYVEQGYTEIPFLVSFSEKIITFWAWLPI